jgi:tetratricopeptide (TPR) repeat protein
MSNDDGSTTSEATEIERSFSAAQRAAETAPSSDDAWDHLEELADKLSQPDPVAELYRSVLETKLNTEVFRNVAERAVQFHDEWFGDTPDKIAALLSRIIELAPESEWAFERLVVMMTSAGQWDELLAVYDKALTTTKDEATRKGLLNDAAQAAKDFADQPDRAADYQQQLLELEPDNPQLVASLERLLDRGQRYADLIALWESQIPHLSADEVRVARLRVATCWLEQLGDHQRAVDGLSALLAENPGMAEACDKLETILELEAVEASTRRQAMNLLRKNYLVAERPDDVVRLLDKALPLAEPDERRPIHRELATRLAVLGRDLDAMQHHRALLLIDPSDPEARKQLRQIATRAGRHDLHAEALVAAAEACEDAVRATAVLLEAAHLHRRALEDNEGAIGLYQRVLAAEEAEDNVALSAAHALEELLGATQRSEERLAVLERLASLEQSTAVRRYVLGEAARLAEALGDVDRALGNWRPVLETTPGDLEALGAVATLLERSERWGELVEALAKRADANVLPLQRRSDLVRIAEIQMDQLQAADAAIATWLKVRKEFGQDRQIVAALDELMSGAGRYAELAHLLGGAAEEDRARSAALSARLGQLHGEELDDFEHALRWHSDAISLDPSNEAARGGLTALLANGPQAADAAEALHHAYEKTHEWGLTLDLLEPRLSSARSRNEQARLLREAATLYAERGDDAESALACLGRALPLEPANLMTEAALMKLADRTGRWATATASLRMAGDAASESPGRRAQLRQREAAIHERQLGDAETALIGYQAAAEATPNDSELLTSVARCAARAGQWSVACEAAVACVIARDRVRPELIEALETGAEATGDWSGLATAMSQGLAERPLPSNLSQRLYVTLAGWQKDRAGDLEGAAEAASHAAKKGPAKLDALLLLADLQRREPGPPLVRTLLELDRLRDSALDELHEASRLALEHPDGSTLSQQVLEALYRKAGRMWLRGEPTTGELEPASVAQWALEQLVNHHIATGNADQAVHAILDGSRLPIERERVVDLRRRAAEMLAERGERARAIEIYRGLLDSSPEDMDALRRVAALCEEEGRVPEALALRLRELALVEDVDRRLELRLDHSRLTGALEAQGGRVASLKANLEDRPGHAPSIQELVEVLEERGKHAELADILADQASQLEDGDASERAAALWTQVAAIAEEHLRDNDRAVAAHSKVVELTTSHDSLNALARLQLSRKKPGEAARWLERRLESASAQERVAVLLKLARARIAAEQREAAVSALESAFADAPRNAEVRKLLLAQYRANKDVEALARTLTTAALAVTDENTVLAYGREAADLYHNRLHKPAESVAALDKAVSIAPDDRQLRAMLAEGLFSAGELDKAKDLLERLIGDFGRRRSPERAQAHLLLAHVLHALAQTEEALDQLETASKMDASNATILKALAELAQKAGQLDRGERALRTLLVTVRHEKEPELLPIGPTEVLFELSRIAADRGDEAKANELLESVLESMAQHDFEAARIQRKLKARGEHELLRRVLDHRLSYVDAPHRRARIYEQLAELLAEALEQPDAALDARLHAVRTDPGSPVHHQAAWDQASSMGQLDRYVSDVEALLSDERADRSAHVRCELLLRLGQVLETERGDLERAAALYGQAEATGVRTVDVWRAQARVAGARGDSDEQIRLLEQLSNLGEDQAETRADALYRMAEVQLANAETVEDGIAALHKALADDFKAERAAMILRRATEEHVGDERLLDSYEQVARRSEDKRTLLHYLTRRATHVKATPEQAREAVEVALELDEGDQAEELMLRAAEIGHAGSRSDDLKRVDWALLGLAERRMEAGDLAGAVKWLGDATEVAELEPLLGMSSRIAELAAAPDGDLTLAAKLYEKVLERAPDARQAWEPLAQICGKLGDVERLERMVDETLDGLQDPADRNALRVALAEALLGHEERAPEAVDVLKQVLVEDPGQERAQHLLFGFLERAGLLDELLEQLRAQLTAAEGRQDAMGVKAASMELCRRVEGDDREAGLEVLRNALRYAPDDAELLQNLLKRLGVDDDLQERARLTETLLAVDPPDEAASRALALVALYDALEDEEGQLRALRLGTERAPDDEPLRARLLERYRDRGDFMGLAGTLLSAASRTEEASGRAALLREAATVRRDQLGDPGGAAELLRQATELAPEDEALVVELARTFSAAGMHDQAVATATDLLEGREDPGQRLVFLRVRAELRGAAGHDAGSIEDLEQAFAIEPPVVAEELEAALTAALDAAVTVGDGESERRFTLRCVEVMLSQHKREAASHMLSAWIQRHPQDVEALRRLRDIDTADARWQAVAETCQRLVFLEQDAAQVDAVLGLSHAYQELGEPAGAREGLEHVRREQPASPQVRAELRKIYEQLDDQPQLARLMLEDAEAVESEDERAEMLRQAGHIFVELGDAVAAIPPLREANKLRPNLPTAVVPLADAYIIAGWFDDANALLGEAIDAGKGRRTPEIGVYLHRRSKVASAQGDQVKQLEHLLEAHQTNKKNGLVAADLANLAEELEQWDLAAKTLRTITLIDTNCPISRAEAFLRQGRLARHQGDDKSAKMWARRAKREDPEWEDIDLFLSELGERTSVAPRR